MTDFVYGIFSPRCYDLYFNEMVYSDMDCMKLVLSKLISIAILTFSFILKVPQILKMWPSGNVQGLNPLMFILEAVGYLLSTGYNFQKGYPFTTYGENAIIFVQNSIIIFLIYFYTKRIGTFVLLSCLFAPLVFVMLSEGIVPPHVLDLIQFSTIFVFSGSRIPQIWTNFRNKSTGSLAALTIFLSFAGNCARIFTTLQEVNDPIVLFGYTASVTTNAIMLMQIGIYWNNSMAVKSKAKNKKNQ